MRTARTRPIRSKVAALLLVPLVSLVAIWAYAAEITGRAALAQRKYHTLNEQFAASGQGLLVELGKERQAAGITSPLTVSLISRGPILQGLTPYARRAFLPLLKASVHVALFCVYAAAGVFGGPVATRQLTSCPTW